MTETGAVLARVRRAIEQVRAGGMVIMVDDEDRENEGDLVFAAAASSPQHVNFMVKEARGLVCLSLEPAIVERLKLPMMADTTKHGPTQTTAFTVSIEARLGVSTGISAADRSRTIHVAINEATQPNDLVVPGHIFPLKARSGGVLERAGHTEGSVDLARMAGFQGAAVICEIMNDDGSMARMPDLEAFAHKHQIPMVAIADLIQYRLVKESLVHEIERRPIRTAAGIFEGVLFENSVDGSQHLALIKGEAGFADAIVDVRVHNQRPLIDVFGDHISGSRYRLDHGLRMLAESANGALVYLSQPASSLAMLADFAELARDAEVATSRELKAAAMDQRQHGTGAQIIRALGISRMRVHSSSPRALKALSGFGLEVVETVLVQNL